MSKMEEFTTITVEMDGAVAVMTLNRPDSLNAFNEKMKTELLDAFKQFDRDERVRCIVVTGAGRGFSSGQDLADLQEMYSGGKSPDLGEMLRRAYNPIIQRMRGTPKPIIAAVNGVAAGAGCSFALACDFRIASTKASFIEAFIHVGLIPDCGGTYFLPRLVGIAKAMELCCLGEKISAEEALRLGLVNRVVEPDALMAASKELARRLANLPTKTIGLTKRLLNQSYSQNLDAQLEAEAFAQTTAARTEDHIEGVRAFVQKRPPAFTGK